MSMALTGELAGDSKYRAAMTAFDAFAAAGQQYAAAAETLEAQLTMYGFDRDAALMEQIREMRERVAAAGAAAARGGKVLVDHHSQGAEYHESGTDAGAAAFRVPRPGEDLRDAGSHRPYEPTPNIEWADRYTDAAGEMVFVDTDGLEWRAAPSW